MTNYRTMCLECVHLLDDDEENPDAAPACEAFPGGIPDEIIRQGFDHRLEFPGDNGIRFEPSEDADMEYIATFDEDEEPV